MLGLPPPKPAAVLHRAMLSSAAKLGFPGGWQNFTAPRAGPSDLERPLTFIDGGCAKTLSKILALRHRIPEEVLSPGELAAAWSISM